MGRVSMCYWFKRSPHLCIHLLPSTNPRSITLVIPVLLINRREPAKVYLARKASQVSMLGHSIPESELPTTARHDDLLIHILAIPQLQMYDWAESQLFLSMSSWAAGRHTLANRQARHLGVAVNARPA